MTAPIKKTVALIPIILHVPPDIQATTGRTKVQALSRLARQAAQASARRLLGKPLTGFPKDDDGVPKVVDGVHWSLSHKPALVAGIVARQPIGIDVEYHRPVKSGMHTRIAAPEEWRLGQSTTAAAIEPPPEILFYRFWTAKEAVLKAVGQGLVGLSNCRITALPSPTRMCLTYLDAPWLVDQCWYGTHLVAIAYQSANDRENPEIQWPNADAPASS